ncbi:small subunit ribosomal protein S1 [Lachnospiraceae bacterium KH1T2]|nr:small subunit ribosomal protein S1 [Lachnospiraceae bacterium KH1T2]
MAESMDDYKKELEASFEKLAEGDVMSGKVADEEQVENNMAWARLKELYDSKESINVKIGGMVNGGLIAYVENVRGFIPASQISLDYVENLDEWLGKNLTVRIITCDSHKNKLVLSAKAILKDEQKKEREDKIAKIQAGMVCDGKVESLQPYGAFVDLGDGVSALLHISQISEKRLKTPGEVLKVGQEVKVKVTGVKDGKISVSMKALNAVDPEAEEEEIAELPEAAPVTTSLGDLLKNIKL